jgi:hypothetical protein
MTAPVEWLAYHHDGHQWRPVLVVKRRRVTIVGNVGRQVRARVIAPIEERHLRPIDNGPPLRQAKARLRSQGRRFGITKAATRLIRNPPTDRQRRLLV